MTTLGMVDLGIVNVAVQLQEGVGHDPHHGCFLVRRGSRQREDGLEQLVGVGCLVPLGQPVYAAPGVDELDDWCQHSAGADGAEQHVAGVLQEGGAETTGPSKLQNWLPALSSRWTTSLATASPFPPLWRVRGGVLCKQGGVFGHDVDHTIDHVLKERSTGRV